MKLGRAPGSAPSGAKTEGALHASVYPASKAGEPIPSLSQREDIGVAPARAIKMSLNYRCSAALPLPSAP